MEVGFAEAVPSASEEAQGVSQLNLAEEAHPRRHFGRHAEANAFQ